MTRDNTRRPHGGWAPTGQCVQSLLSICTTTGVTLRDDESADDRKFPNFTVTPGPSAPLHSSCFFSPPAPPRYFSSRSLRLSRSPPYSPPLSPTSGSSARRSSPAAGGLPLSSPHRSAPRLLLPAVLLPLPFFSAPWPAAGEERRAGPLCSVAGGGGGEARRASLCSMAGGGPLCSMAGGGEGKA